MNKRKLGCYNKEVFAIGQEGSIADYKNKLLTCFECKDFILCKGSQDYLKGIINQQDNLILASQRIK
jgi:hypothetical protein